MGVLEDFRQWLKEVPLWRELEKVPERMDAIEARMTAMEERLKTRPGETCPKCGEHTMRLSYYGRIVGPMGKQERMDDWKCTNPACDHTEERIVRM